MHKFYSILIVCLVFASPVSSQNLKLGILGSSTAEGVGASSKEKSWVGLLNAHYKGNLEIIDTTFNLAKGGKNPYYSMPTGYIPPSNRPSPNTDSNITRLINLGADVIIVSFVSNQYDVFTTEEIKNTLFTIKNAANDAGIDCFVTTTQPRSSFNSTNREKLRKLKDSIIDWFGGKAIDFFTLVAAGDNKILAQYDFGDDIHLNDAGHELLYDQVIAKNIFSAALPVRLLNFDASLRGKEVKLEWTSSDEEDFTQYTIHRSEDGRKFTPIHALKARGSKAKTDYSYTDPFPGQGLNYYRLEIQEHDRTFYSRTVLVRNSSEKVKFRVFPIPASEQITIEISAEASQHADITIVNGIGGIVGKYQRELLKDRNFIQLPITSLAPGTYYIKVSIPGSGVITSSFIKK